MMDPRFTTNYSDNFQGTFSFRSNKFYMPAGVNEKWCEPGYQPKRQDKGFSLTINDYPFTYNYYGPSWANYVHTPFKTPN